jgi:hypothetical protein
MQSGVRTRGEVVQTPGSALPWAAVVRRRSSIVRCEPAETREAAGQKLAYLLDEVRRDWP